MTGHRYWAVIPAAGTGSRMREAVGVDIPKQYLEIGRKTILEHTLERIDCLDCLSGIMVVLGAGDTRWPTLAVSTRAPILTATGGAERAHSVYNGLQALAGQAHEDDWVLVHDVVRPCVSKADLDNLVESLAFDESGGLLVSPVRETLKRVDSSGTVIDTVPREEHRLAATPQMFRFRLLSDALEQALADKAVITDESHAMERAGHRVRTVTGGADNIKITHREDLLLAEFILNRQGND